MTTPPNHNTADQSGAMQPTSSASSADLAALFKELSNCYVIRYGRKTTIELPYDLYDRILAATRNESAIVPQVVQAPSNGAVKTATKVFQSIFFNAGHDGESAYEQMQRAMRAAIISSEYVAAPIVATGDLSTTMPSEAIAKAWYATGQDIRGGSLQSFMDALNAAPSPTEQASDVRNAALEEVAQMLDGFADRCDGWSSITYGVSAQRIRSLKSAPAAKGNAQDEAKTLNLHDYDAAAHMYPSDLERFKTGEHTGSAFSIPVGCPEEESVPLFTLDQINVALKDQA